MCHRLYFPDVSEEIRYTIMELSAMLHFEIAEDGMPVRIQEQVQNGLELVYTDGGYTIYYPSKVQLFRICWDWANIWIRMVIRTVLKFWSII